MADAQPLDDATLEELERVAAAMTEGPWRHELLGPGKLRYRITNPKGDAELGNWLVGEVRWGVNATGIALLRNHASALLHSSREAARLRAELAAERERCKRIVLEYCQCHEAWTGRNLIDPHCPVHYIADHIDPPAPPTPAELPE
jgi:hypothetical protein